MLVIFIILLAAAIFVPQWWIGRVMRRYQEPKDRYPGSGAELARHLLDHLGLESVRVEPAGEVGDHYDPKDRVVRLSQDNHDGRSLTAVTVAAHEVGHAVQHADGYRPLIWRTRLVETLARWQRIGVVLIALMPVAILALKMPRAGLILLVMGLATLASGIIVHLVTLPTELDARLPASPADAGKRRLSAHRRPAARPPHPHRRRLDLRGRFADGPGQLLVVATHPQTLNSALEPAT